ncbi:rho guanine nucleotide exchange factor 4 isoform X1 [Pitangus sulphuratus]|nr:rho guanine nucleotide exchange factor 4 isoform X1 [Pitangus sulphuratus]
MEKISGHIKPRQSVVLQRFQFKQWEQLPGETFITSKALALQKLASVCAFGCWQEELILDQLIDKAADRRIREKLLMELDTLTLAQAAELGSQMERVLQRTCPGFVSVLTKQWENWSSSKICKIRNDNCCNQWYWRGQRRSPALSTKYSEEKQNQFIPCCHSPMSSTWVMRRQHLDWQLRYPAISNTNSRRVRKFQTPQPVENYISEGEFEDDLSTSTPSTTELEVRGSSQETDEDYFETVSHQSGSLSDVKTEPYESASDTESLSSDVAGNTCLDSNCLFTEKKPLCCNFPKEKAETTFHELTCSRQPEFTQHIQFGLSYKIKAAPRKAEFSIQSARAEGEELDDEEQTFSSDISITENQFSEEGIVSQAKRRSVEALQNKEELESFKVQSCSNSVPTEDDVTRQREHPAVLNIACFKENSESCLIFPEVQQFSSQTDTVPSCSLPNLHFETNGPNCKSYIETSDYKCELDSMSSIKCSRRNSADGEETTGKRIKHGRTETMLTSDSLFYQSCFKTKSWPLHTRSEITESKTWQSVPENISAQSQTEYVGSCIHLTNKFRRSCPRIPLQGLDFENTWKTLGRISVSSESTTKVEGQCGIKRSLLDADTDSNECQVSQPAGSPPCTDHHLHSESETRGLSPEPAGTCTDSLTQGDAGEGSPRQKKTSSALDCEPVTINTEELIKGDEYKAEGALEAGRFPCDTDAKSDTDGTENLAAFHVGFPAVVENRDWDCSVNCVSRSGIEQKPFKENGLESELSGMEIVAGERWVDRSSNLDFGWKFLRTTVQPGGSDTGTEHEEPVKQNTSCKTGTLRNDSELATNEHPTLKEKDEESDSVFAVERTPTSDYINQRRDLVMVPELKPALIGVSVEQKGLQSQTLNDDLPTEVVTKRLRKVVSRDLRSLHTVNKAHDEPERVLGENCVCKEQILATQPIPGCAEVPPDRDTAEVKPEVLEEKREKTNAVSSLGFTSSNPTATREEVEFRSVTVPLSNDTLSAESQTDPCKEVLIKSHSPSVVKVSEEQPCTTQASFELKTEQFRKSGFRKPGTRDDHISEEEELIAHQGREEEEGLYITNAVTQETSSSVSSLCQGDGVDVGPQGPSTVKSRCRSGVMVSEEEPCRAQTAFELEQFRKSGFRKPETRDDQVFKEQELKAHQGREEGLYKTSAVTLETSSSVSSLCQGDGTDVDLQGPSIVSDQALGRQGNEGCNGSKEEIGICEGPSPREGREGSAAEGSANPSKDSALSLDVSDVFDEAVNREIHNTCMLGLDNISTCSTNSEEMDDNLSHILGSNNSLYKTVQKPTKNENSGKASRFLVFSKMTSFRKTKPATAENQGSSSFFGIKAKIEELEVGKDDEDTASLLSFKSCPSGLVFHRKESYTSEYSDDDDLFYERPAGLFNRLSLRKASGSGRILMEDTDMNSASPCVGPGKYADRQVSGSSENNDGEPLEHSGIRKSFPENEYKRNKTPEGKKFKTRLALAHKSLSSLFESRSTEKENTEQSSRGALKNEKEKAKLRQSTWKAFLKSKEADGLKRPVLASLSPTQEGLSATGGHVVRTSVERQSSSNGHTFLKTEADNGSNYFDSSVEPVDVSSPAGMWRRRIQSHDLGIKYSQSSDCDEQQEILSNSLNTSLEEYWMKSPFSPADLQLAFSQSSPSCPHLSNSDGKDMPCRPMSPKPQSPRSTSHHKTFRYPGRVCATSMISLGNSSGVESCLEAPERPKTLKPRGSLLLSVHSLDTEYQRDDSGISSQSQISLNTASSISDMLQDEECRQQCQTAPEKRPNKKWVPHRKRRPPWVPPSPRPDSTLESKAWRLSFLAPDEKAKEIPERRRKRPKPLYKCFSFDDVWMERNQKRKLEKETRPERGAQVQHLPGDPLKAGRSPSITSPVAFDMLPLKLHPFSQSTPTGLDCVGWKRRISAPGVYTRLSWA